MASPSATPSGSRSGPSTWRSGTGRPAARRAPPPFVPAAPTHDALDRFVGSRPGSEVSHRGATPPAYEPPRGPADAYPAHPSAREQEYGIGNRILPDRHADKPLGGEIEAGYGIGNRHLPDAKDAGGYSSRGGYGGDAPYGYDAPYGQGSPGNVSSGRPPVAPRSAKEEYAAALRAQMAEKEAREPRGRSRVRTPESAGGLAGAPASVAPASRDPSQDRRTAQLEYAAALQQQMQANADRRRSDNHRGYAEPSREPPREREQNNIFGSALPQSAPAAREPNNVFGAGDMRAPSPARSR